MSYDNKKLLFIVGIGSTYKLNLNIWTTNFLYEMNSYRREISDMSHIYMTVYRQTLVLMTEEVVTVYQWLNQNGNTTLYEHDYTVL